MKRKWAAIKSCPTCDGTGYFTNPFDVTYRCECYKKTKKYKNRRQDVDSHYCFWTADSHYGDDFRYTIR